MLCAGLIGWRVLNTAICAGNLWTDPVVAATFPVEEAAYIQQMPKVTRLGNTYGEGGYLMYQLWPTTKVMIDPRLFPFRSLFVQEYRFELGQDIQPFVDQYKADAWFIPHNITVLIRWFFSQPNTWAPLFFGPAGMVFGHAEGVVSKLKYSPNIAKTKAIEQLEYAFDTAVMLKNWSLAAQLQTQTAMLAASSPACKPYRILSHEMLDAIIGLRAFDAGNYATAAAHLSAGGYFIHPIGVAITALKIMAKRAWDSDDYAVARADTMKVLNLNQTDVINIYNAAIADWQYKQSTAANQLHISDDITWQYLGMLVLSQQDKIAQSDHLIIDVLTAMRQGVLVKKPEFILRQLEQP